MCIAAFGKARRGVRCSVLQCALQRVAVYVAVCVRTSFPVGFRFMRRVLFVDVSGCFQLLLCLINDRAIRPRIALLFVSSSTGTLLLSIRRSQEKRPEAYRRHKHANWYGKSEFKISLSSLCSSSLLAGFGFIFLDVLGM